MLYLAQETQYRLVGTSTGEYRDAVPVQPGLEDSYVWLMKQTEPAEVTI